MHEMARRIRVGRGIQYPSTFTVSASCKQILCAMMNEKNDKILSSSKYYTKDTSRIAWLTWCNCYNEKYLHKCGVKVVQLTRRFSLVKYLFWILTPSCTLLNSTRVSWILAGILTACGFPALRLCSPQKGPHVCDCRDRQFVPDASGNKRAVAPKRTRVGAWFCV